MDKRPNIVIVGANYVGVKVASDLAPKVSQSHKIVLVETNSHFQHLIAFPRITVVGGFENKAFIPYTNAFDDLPRHSTSLVHGTVTRVLPEKVMLEDGRTIPYEYLVVANGMGAPGAVTFEEKRPGVSYFQQQQGLIRRAEHITVIGGGAYGVQIAFDIKDFLGEQKQVAIIHSRNRLLNRFHQGLHDIVSERLEDLDVEVILGQRVQIPDEGFPTGSRFGIRLSDGRILQTDLVILCIGPLSDKAPPILSSLSPDLSSVPVPVKSTLQLRQFPRIFVAGDAADCGAAKSANQGYMQAEVVVHNIASMIHGEGKLNTFESPPHGINLHLGERESVIFLNPAVEGGEPEVRYYYENLLDIGCEIEWKRLAKNYPDYDS